MTNNLRINERIESDNKSFSYELFWPYEGVLNPDKDSVNVFVKIKKTSISYVGTFVTLDEIKRWFERSKESGEYASGTYVIPEKNIILEKITENAIDRTIDDLIQRQEFEIFFIPKSEE